MPTTSFAGKRPTYLEQYARTVAAFQRYQDITRDIQAEQDRLNYLDSLVQSERQNLTNLQEVFRVRPQDLGSAQALLQQQYASEDAERRRVAAGAAGRAAGLQLSREQRAELRALTVGAGRQPVTAVSRALELITADTTPEQGAEIVRLLERGGIEEREIDTVRQQLEQVARGRAPSGAPRAVSPEEQAAERALQQQLEAAFFAGPAGIRGGYDGQAIVERREQTAAPKGLSFSTEQDAFEAALTAMQDGTLAAEDFASAEDFEFAKALYDEAKAKKAYRNDQRANFETEVLQSRARIAQLEQARAEAPGAQYTDPGRERARRELVARGYDPERNQGRYLQYQQSPYYNAMIRADDLLNEVLSEDVDLEAVTRPQRLARDLVQQLDAAGRPYDIKKLERQLGKALKGDDLQEALAFALAEKEYSTTNLANPSQRELKRAQQEAEAKREEQAQQLDAEITADLEKEFDQQAFFTKRLSRPEAGPPKPELDMLRKVVDLDEPEPPAPAVSEIVQDPTDPRFLYRKTDRGYAVYEKDKPIRLAAPGTTAFKSIEQVLAGGQPLPPAPPPAPRARPERVMLEPMTITAEAPAGEAEPPAPVPEPAPEPAPKRLKWNPQTQQFE
jgi:hypothetical protein